MYIWFSVRFLNKNQIFFPIRLTVFWLDNWRENKNRFYQIVKLRILFQFRIFESFPNWFQCLESVILDWTKKKGKRCEKIYENDESELLALDIQFLIPKMVVKKSTRYEFEGSALWKLTGWRAKLIKMSVDCSSSFDISLN